MIGSHCQQKELGNKEVKVAYNIPVVKVVAEELMSSWFCWRMKKDL